MKVLAIDNIVRREMPIHYRRNFTGNALLQLPGDRERPCRIEFTLEHGPTGQVEVQLQFLELPDYPLVPVMKAVKAHIASLDRKGALP